MLRICGRRTGVLSVMPGGDEQHAHAGCADDGWSRRARTRTRSFCNVRLHSLGRASSLSPAPTRPLPSHPLHLAQQPHAACSHVRSVLAPTPLSSFNPIFSFTASSKGAPRRPRPAPSRRRRCCCSQQMGAGVAGWVVGWGGGGARATAVRECFARSRRCATKGPPRARPPPPPHAQRPAPVQRVVADLRLLVHGGHQGARARRARACAATAGNVGRVSVGRVSLPLTLLPQRY